jgi:hypothetical protein
MYLAMWRKRTWLEKVWMFEEFVVLVLEQEERGRPYRDVLG